MQRLQRLCAGSFFLLYPFLSHLFIVRGAPDLAVALLAAASAMLCLWHVLTAGGAPAMSFVYGILAAAAGASFLSGAQIALYLPPIVFNAWLMALFGLSLRRGSTPLIERFMRAAHSEGMTPSLQRYGRRLTMLWSVFSGGMALTAVLLALFAPLETWSFFSNVLSYALIMALFVAQFVYARFRYPHHRPPYTRLMHIGLRPSFHRGKAP